MKLTVAGGRLILPNLFPLMDTIKNKPVPNVYKLIFSGDKYTQNIIIYYSFQMVVAFYTMKKDAHYLYTFTPNWTNKRKDRTKHCKAITNDLILLSQTTSITDRTNIQPIDDYDTFLSVLETELKIRNMKFLVDIRQHKITDNIGDEISLSKRRVLI